MACGDYATYWEYWTNGQMFDGVQCVFIDQLGAAPTALLLFAPIALALFIHNDAPDIPVVLGFLVGSLIITQLPAAAQNIALMLIVLSGSVIISMLGMVVLNRWG